MFPITTEDLISEFFESRPEATRKKQMSQISRAELYDFEIESGKVFLEFDVTDIANVVNSFGSGAKENWRKTHVTIATKRLIVSTFRKIYDFYNENHEPKIANPLRTKDANQILEKMVYAYNVKFTEENVQAIRNFIRSKYADETAVYLECLIDLYIDGFREAAEIAQLKEEDINFKTRIITVNGRTVRLKDSTMKRLITAHSYMDKVTSGGRYVFFSWNRSYFPIIVKVNMTDGFNDKSVSVVAQKICDKLTKSVLNQIRTDDLDVNYRMLFLYGFYRHLVEAYGEEDVRDMVYSVNDSQYTERYCSTAEAYGVSVGRNITLLKKMMMQFI